MDDRQTAGTAGQRGGLTRRGALQAAGALTAASWSGTASAQKAAILRLGVLTDLSGPYQGIAGPLSVAATRQAIQDFGAQAGFSVEVLMGDHQNKPDVGSGIVRQWLDRDGVDAVIDAAGSAVGLAVQGVTREKNKVFLNTGSSSTLFSGAQCSPNAIQWTYDTYLLAASTGTAVVKSGGKRWFFVNADYQFGQQLRRDASAIVEANGGTVMGGVAYPFPGTTDFSSMLLQAQGSGADVLAFANGGADTVNSVKQATEFGLNKSMRVAALLMFISDVHATGLETAAGLLLTETFYWDLNPATRAFAARLKSKVADTRPGMLHAGAYSATLHYLKTVHALGIDAAKADGRATVARMKATPSDDDCFGVCKIRQDGRRLMPAYLFQVKTPDQSTGPWDYYKHLATTPADEAAQPLAKGNCPLLGESGTM